MSLDFYFTTNPKFELIKLHFKSSELEQSNVLIRGKDRGAYRNCGSFQWSQAVKAFCLFFLREKIHSISSKNDFIYRGLKYSAAASLDYALGKPPNWMIELFGITTGGDCLSRKFFKRTNPELKRQGPVEIGINKTLEGIRDINIFINDSIESESSTLNSYANELELFFEKGINSEIIKTNSNAFDLFDFSTFLKQDFLKEAQRTLLLSDIFSQKGKQRTLSRIKRNLSLPTLEFKNSSFSNPTEDSLSRAEQLGALTTEQLQYLQKLKNLTVAMPAGQAGSCVIFNYLKNIRRINLTFDYNYQYAIEIIKKVYSNNFISPPEILVLGLAPAATMINNKVKTGYTPLMIAPGFTHRLLSPKSEVIKPSPYSELYLLLEDTSTSQIYFELLKGIGQINEKTTKVFSAAPDEIFSALNSGDRDVRAINFFPYYDINEKFNNSSIIDADMSELNITESVIFVHESIAKDKILIRALAIALRDAWLTLADGGSELSQTVNAIFEDKNLIRLICRFSGLSNQEDL